MESSLALGLGVSIVSGFARWRWPSIPKPLATAGCVAGVGLVVWSQLGGAAEIAIPWIIGTVVVIAAMDFLLSRRTKPRADREPPRAQADQSVRSHNQSGGITARTVNIGVREPNALYQNGKKVATAHNGTYTEKESEIIFSEIRFTDSADTTKPLEFQSALLLCDTPSVISTAAYFLDLREKVRCRVVGNL